jgi:BirA family biotin operon repressor/biotin-[acetyl-CoA-carboxylase] ligase
VSAERLATLLLARGARWPAPIEWHAEIASTNDRLKELARSGAPAWTVAIADRQSAGRGRRGNAWASPLGNLHLSVLLPVPGDAAALTLIPLVAGLAVAEAVEEQGPPARLKWPNDVLLGGRKVAGVLAEAASNGQGVDSIVLGIGLNVAASPGDVVAELRETTTCLAAALQRPVELPPIAAAVLARLRDRIGRLLDGEREASLSAWNERAREWWGRPIEVTAGAERVHGVALGVDASGALLVDLAGGGRRAFLSGEARELRLEGSR